jgi:urease accessory protein
LKLGNLTGFKMILDPSSSPDRRLALMQLSDSFFPSGSFTLSQGLESLVQSGQIQSADDVQTFLNLLLRNKVRTTDLIALIHAYRASAVQNLEEIRRADLSLFARTLIQGSREAQQKSGRALLMVAGVTWTDVQLEFLQSAIQSGEMQGLYPIVFAVVSRTAALSESDAVFAFLHNFVTGIIGAAIRLGVMGHLNAQVILKQTALQMERVAAEAAQLSLADMSSCTPSIDLAIMGHRKLERRLFFN